MKFGYLLKQPFSAALELAPTAAVITLVKATVDDVLS
jgi:hypothetical protein